MISHMAPRALTEEVAGMARLYRSTMDCQYWLVCSDDHGWARFPAKVNGWKERRPMNLVDRRTLCRVPLRLAFNTGLLESLELAGFRRAA